MADNTIDNGGTAFPKTGSYHAEAGGEYDSIDREGMSLRDWFAGHALNGLAEIHHGIGVDPQSTARAAYQFADAMIVARKACA